MFNPRSLAARKKLLQLYLKQDWLSKKNDKILSLVDLCDTDEQIDFIFDILVSFSYFSRDAYDRTIQSVVQFISSTPGATRENSQIVAMSHDHQTDSGQSILYDLKASLSEVDWDENIETVNVVPKAIRFIENRPNIFLVDEFSGTGRTVNGRIKYIKEQTRAKDKQINRTINEKIHVCLLAAMEPALIAIQPNSDSVFCPFQLPRGVSDRYSGQDLVRCVSFMKLLEDKLEQDDAFPSFGDGRAEALYARDGGNTPNSVFPIFW